MRHIADGTAQNVEHSLTRLEGLKTKSLRGNHQEITTGQPTNRNLNIVHAAERKWRSSMDKRFVNKEFSLLKRLTAFISDLLYAKDDLQKRLELIPDGNKRMDKVLDDVSELIKDLLSTGPDNQKKTLLNTVSDYKLEFVPRLSPGSSNIVITKAQAKKLIDIAQEKCTNCVEDYKKAQSCALYQLLEVTALPDSYDTMLCPYSQAEWKD